METILLTGGAGFIGSHLAEALLNTGSFHIICVDNMDNFYPVRLKWKNLEALKAKEGFRFVEADMTALTLSDWENICRGEQVTKIIHLAAKAGVRPSIADPEAYYRSNVGGTLSLLEFARHAAVPRFIFSSSSSVYGENPCVPWKESELNLLPISPYAATKIAGEQLGQVYAHLFGLQFTALRLFTVYGPRQRPDLAIHTFYSLIRQNQEISLYGDGSTSRDYTFVGDIVQGILSSLDYMPQKDFEVFNLGSGRPVSLLQMVRSLESVMGIRAQIRFLKEQPGDVKQTWADISRAKSLLGYHPDTNLHEGIGAFLTWKEMTHQVGCP